MDDKNRFNDFTIQKAIGSLKHTSQQLDSMRLPVLGGSMTPMLRDRDILEISLILPAKLTCGDIVVRGKHELITHRVLFSRHGRVYTKGDSRYWIDPMSSRNDIFGKVRYIERNGLIVDMGSFRWKVINRLIGFVGQIQVYLVWPAQVMVKSRETKVWWHRLSHWLGKRMNWVILFLLAGKWLFQKPLRMDEKC